MNEPPFNFLHDQMNFTVDDSLKLLLRENLSSLNRITHEEGELRHAAVAIVVIQRSVEDSHPYVLLTRRAAKLRKHAGQYALPGGKVEPGESAKQAALRELWEELGLKLSEENVMGLLDDYSTRSGFRITPVVVWAGPNQKLVPSADEVAEVFHISFDELNEEKLPILDYTGESEKPVLSVYLSTLGHEVYSPTAAILYQFREVAIRNQQTRVEGFDQPRFAWK